jgi:lactoylglutathione lyase
MFKRIDHIALHVTDLSKSVDFYTSNFEFTKYYHNTTPNGIKITYMMLGDSLLELAQEPDGGLQGFHFCIQTTDFDSAVKKLLSNDVKILNEPHHTNPRQPEERGWRRAVFAGPDGEQIEIRG